MDEMPSSTYSIDEDMEGSTSLRTPLQLPQTNFKNIFGTKRVSCDSALEREKQRTLNTSANLNTNAGLKKTNVGSKVRDYSPLNPHTAAGDTLDKGLTQNNNWFQSTLACTLQSNSNTRNTHANTFQHHQMQQRLLMYTTNNNLKPIANTNFGLGGGG